MEFTQEFADIKTYRERLDDLAKNALNETASLKGIITKKLDELVTKCDNDGLNAMMDVISDIGMFDGAAFNVLVDNAGFSCAKFEEAVKQDQEMVSTAYQVKDNYTDDEMMDETDG
uniref:Phage protein n=1 Tax=Globodera pallida TaxID=36090 RepID=A0A183BLB3_GLOPA